MRLDEDAQRSVRRWCASMFGQPWRVRLDMGNQKFKRPFVLIDTPVGRTMPAGGVDTVRPTMPVVIQAFPVEFVDPFAAKMEAERAGEVIKNAILIGVQDALDPTVRGYRQRIPLWDYMDEENVPLPLEGEGSISMRRTPRDYLEVVDGWSVEVLPEASPDQLWNVNVVMSVRWFRNAREPLGGPALSEVRFEVDVEGDVP